MKKILLSASMLLLTANFCVNAQTTILSEDFEGVSPPALPAGWSTSTIGTDGGFYTGDYNDANAAGYWPVPDHTQFVMTNDDVCDCDKSLDYLTLPTFNFTGYSAVVLSFAGYDDGTYGGNPSTIELNINGAGWNVIYTFTQLAAWQDITVLLSGTDNTPNIQVRFHYDDNGAWATGLAIDDVLIYEPVDRDASVTSIDINDYVLLGSGPQTVTGELTNYGSTTITSLDLNWNVDGGPVYTQSLSSLSIASLGTYSFSHSDTWTPSSTGTYNIIVWATNINGSTDQNTSNDALDKNIIVVDQIIQRNVLVEEFTSSTCAPCASQNPAFNALLFANQVNTPGSNVLAIKYQMNWPSPGTDPNYNSDGDTRKSFYSVSGVPQAEMDGADIIGGSYDGSPSNLDQQKINDEVAKPAFIEIDATHTILGNTVDITAIINPIQDFPSSNLRVHIAVIEDTVYHNIQTNGETVFYEVMRKMLTNGSGNSIPPLTNGNPVTVTKSYTFTIGGVAQGNFNLWVGMDKISIIVFVQDNATKEIHQAVLSSSSSCSLSITTSANNPTCGNNNGSATASVSGGTSPYTYSWSSGGSSSTETGLGTGTYTVTVTDNNGCQATGSVTLTDPGTLSLSISPTDPTCGNSDGSAFASVSGGTLPYTYQWDSYTGDQTTQTATGLDGGTYTLTVTDANGCTGISSTTLNSPSGTATLTINTTDVNCNGGIDGSVTVTATGGTTPYTYLWDSYAGDQTTATATGLPAGMYSVTVTEANGCINDAFANIYEPSSISAGYSTTEPNCGSSDGDITIYASGGISPYTYLWDSNAGAQTTQTATALSAGTYYVTITDDNGCDSVFSVNLSDAGAGLLSTTRQDVTCNGASDGSASVTISGGTSPYTYLWNTSATTSSIGGLSEGTYTVTVTDAAGCVSIDDVIIFQPSPLIISTSYTIVSSDTICDGEAIAIPGGGTWPYTYQWDDPSSQITATATALCIGLYNVTVTDNNGCIATASVYVDSVLSGIISVPVIDDNSIKVYPNPIRSKAIIVYKLGKQANIQLALYDITGRRIKLFIDEEKVAGAYQQIIDDSVTDLTNGIYLVTLKVNEKLYFTKVAIMR
ncbi:MAG: T9SS type A sorting domain-containing protein [Bacteroidota bacterium]